MRRSLQTIVLCEAYRCLNVLHEQYNFKSYQLKFAFYEQVVGLLHQLPFLHTDKDREMVLYRKLTTTEPISPEHAWKRWKRTENELKNLVERLKQFTAPGRRHEAICDLMGISLHVSKKKIGCNINNLLHSTHFFAFTRIRFQSLLLEGPLGVAPGSSSITICLLQFVSTTTGLG
jgi:hypothetical protein